MRCRANAIVWDYFEKDPIEKKGKCRKCGQMISFEKSSYSNLKRHLIRKHPYLNRRKGVPGSPMHTYIWNHFERESAKKAKCKHCDKTISCLNNTFNMRRHMSSKHPSITLIDGDANEGDELEETLYDDPLEAYESSNYSKPSKTSFSSNESEPDTESKHGTIELQPIDNNDLTEPIRIEIIDLNPEPKAEADNSDIFEESNHNSDAMTNYEQMSATHNDHNHTDDLGQVLEETITETEGTSNVTHTMEMGYERGSCKFLGIDMKDINIKTAAYATHMALELEQLESRQRVVVEKLISDILFHAKLDNLTEYSMVLVKVGSFEKDC